MHEMTDSRHIVLYVDIVQILRTDSICLGHYCHYRRMQRYRYYSYVAHTADAGVVVDVVEVVVPKHVFPKAQEILIVYKLVASSSSFEYFRLVYSNTCTLENEYGK